MVRTSNSTATSLEASGLGLYPSRSKVQLANDDNVVAQKQAAEAGGIFSFQSLSGHDFNSNSKEVREHLETPHNISTSQQLLSAALQNDETWRGNRSGTTTTATATATRSNNNNNAANLDSGYNIMA